MVRLNQPAQFASKATDPGDLDRIMRRVETAPVIDHPFAHMMIEEPLDPCLVDDLIADYPTPDSMKIVAQRYPRRNYSDKRLCFALPEPRDPALQNLQPSLKRLSNLLCAPVFVGGILRRFPAQISAAVDHLPPDREMTLRVAIELIHDRTGFSLRPVTSVKLV
jgi:hypothetical protein